MNRILLGSIVLAAAALRFHALGAKSFWLDEAMSVEIARLPWHQLLFDLWHREANMAPYYVLLHTWLALGAGEGFIRALSVLFSVATIPMVYALGARLLGRPAGMLAAWFLAINAYHIRYAQEARAYAMVVFFAALASWLFVKNIEEPAAAHWKTYTAACVLCAYSHFYGALIVVSHAVSLAFLPRGHADWHKIARSLAWFSLFVVPIAVFSAQAGTAPLNWIPRIDRDTLPTLAILFAGNYGPGLMILDLAMLGLAALSAIRVWRESGRTVQAWRYGLLFSWLCVPPGIVLVASLVRPLFFSRFFIPCLPAFVLLVAAGFLRLRAGVLSWILFAAISVGSVVGTFSYYRVDFDLYRPHWREAVAYVLDHSQPGDSVYSGRANQEPFEFYRWQRRPAPAWPKNLNPPTTSNEAKENWAVIPGTTLRAAKPVGDRVWLLLPYTDSPGGKPDLEGSAVRDWFAIGRHRAEVQRLPWIEVVLYVADAANSFRPEKPRP